MKKQCYKELGRVAGVGWGGWMDGKRGRGGGGGRMNSSADSPAYDTERGGQ